MRDNSFQKLHIQPVGRVRRQAPRCETHNTKRRMDHRERKERRAKQRQPRKTRKHDKDRATAGPAEPAPTRCEKSRNDKPIPDYARLCCGSLRTARRYAAAVAAISACSAVSVKRLRRDRGSGQAAGMSY